jgi:hypothetical protein
MRQPVEETNEDNDWKEMKRMFKQHFKHHRGHGSPSCSSNEEGPHGMWGHGHGHGHGYHGHGHGPHGHGHGHGNGRFFKKIWGLSFIFGGAPEDYKEFAQKYDELKPRETFKKFADENGISEEEFNQKLVNMRCQKLSRNFGKEPGHYREFVEKNKELDHRELMEKLFEEGIEKREDRKCWWGGRKFNFNDAFQKEECSFKKDKASPKKEKSASKEMKCQRRKCSPMEEPKSLDKPEISQKKGAILLKMLDIFGTEKQGCYVKFIDKYFALGEEKIIDLWMQQ